MRLKALTLSFTMLLTLSLGTFSYAAEPIEGSEINQELIAQVEAENAALAKTDNQSSSRLPASVDSEEPKK